MHTSDYLRILVEEIHSAVIATIGPDGAGGVLSLRSGRGIF